MAHYRGKKTRGYRSRLEALVAANFKKRRYNFEYETRKLNYTIEKTYTPDFIVDDVYFEVKGVLMTGDRNKYKAIRKSYPSLHLVFVFAAPHQRCPGLKATHAEWAEKNGWAWTTPDKLSKKDIRECLKRTSARNVV